MSNYDNPSIIQNSSLKASDALCWHIQTRIILTSLLFVSGVDNQPQCSSPTALLKSYRNILPNTISMCIFTLVCIFHNEKHKLCFSSDGQLPNTHENQQKMPPAFSFPSSFKAFKLLFQSTSISQPQCGSLNYMVSKFDYPSLPNIQLRLSAAEQKQKKKYFFAIFFLFLKETLNASF